MSYYRIFSVAIKLIIFLRFFEVLKIEGIYNYKEFIEFTKKNKEILTFNLNNTYYRYI